MAKPFIEVPKEEYLSASINSIKKKYPDLRQASKPSTFALQYQGTWHTLIKNCGFSAKEAKHVEKSYHALYAVSDQWVDERLREAAESGYVTAAFGLRVRTPLLAKTVYKGKNTPYEAAAEGRTAGNALGQSWCLLNSRAANAFMERVWASDFRLDIRPCAQIHDAIYLLIRNDTDVLKWVNDNLIECMRWQEHPAIVHDTVHIGAELDVFYKGWHQPITLPNDIDTAQIRKLCVLGAREYNQPKQK